MNTATLFVACVLIWGTTWWGIKFQLAAIAPEPGVALRFLCASVLLAGFCRLRSIPLAFPRRLHLMFAAQGIAGFCFCLSYIFVYHAERFLVSGVVAVGYAASPLTSTALARLFLAEPMSRRVLTGGLLGIAGTSLIFIHELARLSLDWPVLIGAALTCGAVLLSGLAGIAASRCQREDVHGWAPLAWAMFYGGAASAAVALALGRPFAIVLSAAFAASFAYLVIGGSILAFGAFYALVRRVGVARAGYVGVMTPIVALIVSSLAEGFTWNALSLAGIALAVAGNLLALTRGARRRGS